MSSRILVATLVCALLGSCSRIIPVLVINHRPEAVRVAYRFEIQYFPDGRLAGCGIKGHSPRLVPGTNPRSLDWSRAVDAAFEYDEGLCEARFVLPSGSSAVIATNELCNGSLEHIGREGEKPRLKHLRIESDGGTIELNGWEVARSLVEKGGFFSIAHCRYDVR